MFNELFLYVISYNLIKYCTNFQLNKNNHINFVSQLVSILHTSIIIPISILYLTEFIDVDYLVKYSNYTIAFSIYDSVLVFYYRNTVFKNWKEVILHHIIMLFIVLHIHLYPYEISLGLISEITNIPLYYCWYLIKTKHDKQKNIMTWNFKVSSIILLILFTLFRIILFTYLSFVSLKTELPYYKKSITPCLTFLNYYWYYKLVQKFIN